MFKTAEECIDYIENIKRFSKRETLDRMKLALDLLEHPEKKFKKIHVAGTNGKGSTTKFISSILEKYDLRIGTFTSPYIEKFNERIQINEVFIADEDLIIYTNKVYELTLKMEQVYQEHLTFFEVLTLICFLYFSAKEVDIAVIEVGLGGRLDATNCVSYDCSIITSIGYDHMAQLGNTLESIAENKLGIIKEAQNCLLYHQSDLDDIFERRVRLMGATSKKIANNSIAYIEMDQFIYEEHIYKLKMVGEHQFRNAVLAIEVCKRFVPFQYDLFYQGLSEMFWKARLQKISDVPLIYCDGAHNIHGIEALCFFIKKQFEREKIEIIFCAMKDKETEKMLEELQKVSNKVFVTEIDYYRCKKVMDYTEDFVRKILLNHFLEQIKEHALNPKQVYFITGSLYFMSHVLNQLHL